MEALASRPHNDARNRHNDFVTALCTVARGPRAALSG
jgi:hypothetical protein